MTDISSGGILHLYLTNNSVSSERVYGLSICRKKTKRVKIDQLKYSQYPLKQKKNGHLKPLFHFISQRRDAPVLWASSWIPLDLLHYVHLLLQSCMQHCMRGLLGVQESGRITPSTCCLCCFGCSPGQGGFLVCEHTLTGHGKLCMHQIPQVLVPRAALNPFPTQPVLVLDIALTHVQHLALGLVELDDVCTVPPLRPAKVPLDDICSLQCVDHATQIGVELAEGVQAHWPCHW